MPIPDHPAYGNDESEISQMSDHYRPLLEELLADDSDKMTAWEVEFIESLDRQNFWSEKQVRTLQEIWDKVFG